MLNCLFFRIFPPFVLSGCGLLPASSIWQGAGGPATSQMRCWPPSSAQAPYPSPRRKRQVSSIPLRLLSKSQSRCWIAILCFLRTSTQRESLRHSCAHTRCRGRKPHTAATRASRRGAGARYARRVDRADCFHGQKIGTFGTLEGNPPFAVATVGICQNPVFP